jgi:hypothetical protein
MKNIIIDGVEYTPVIKQSQIVDKHYHFELHPDNLGEMTWYEAVEVVKNLGDGWRLPTIEECFMIYEDKLINDNHYWSSTEYGSYTAWYFGFGSGDAYVSSKVSTYYLRAVRALKNNLNRKTNL